MSSVLQAGNRRTGAEGSLRHMLWRARWPLIFVAPFFILFGIFGVYPVFFAFWLSLHTWRGVGPMEFVGLANYHTLMSDGFFWGSMFNAGLLFFLYVPLMTMLAIIIAVILNGAFLRLQGLWRSLVFLPYITSMVAAGYTFRLMLDTHSGIVNGGLGMLGLGPVPWLDSAAGARVALGALMVWAWLGYNTVIMLAGLQTIPSDLSEAARVDGANSSQIFWRITVPLLRPVIIFSVTLSIIGTFQMYTEPLILTGGGPFRATEMPVMQIFATTFSNLRFGYAAAMSYIYLIIIVIITMIQFRFVSREE